VVSLKLATFFISSVYQNISLEVQRKSLRYLIKNPEHLNSQRPLYCTHVQPKNCTSSAIFNQKSIQQFFIPIQKSSLLLEDHY